jgi:putative acetyltransferase
MDNASFDIRYSQASDLLFLNSWVSKQEVMDWLPISDEKERDMATSCWIGFAKFKSSLTATIDHTPCGMATIFLMPYKRWLISHVQNCCQSRLAAPGVGTALLKNISTWQEATSS